MAKELCQAIFAFLDCCAEFSNSLEPAEGNVAELLATRGSDFGDAGHFLNGPNKALKSVAIGFSVEVFLRRLATLAAEIDEFGFRQFGESFNCVVVAFYVCGLVAKAGIDALGVAVGFCVDFWHDGKNAETHSFQNDSGDALVIAGEQNDVPVGENLPVVVPLPDAVEEKLGALRQSPLQSGAFGAVA